MSGKPTIHRWFTPGERVGLGEWPRVDFQMHTRWTDGRSTIREMIEAAAATGLDAIAITEHVNAGSGWYPEFVAEVQAERDRHATLEIFYGAEIAAADYRGGLKADRARLDAEVVLGVVHRLPKQDGSGFWSFDELCAGDAIELEIRALTGLARSGAIDVLGHPGGTAFRKFGAFPVEWLEPVFREAREHGLAVELNTKYVWDLEGMLALLRRVGPLVSFGSDAHHANEVGANLPLMQEAVAHAI
jgi:histidinol phosphatase-like PHP family hydrolase